MNAGARDNLEEREKQETYNIFHSVVQYKNEFPALSTVTVHLLALDAKRQLRSGERLLLLCGRNPNNLDDPGQYSPLELACDAFYEGPARSNANHLTRDLIKSFVDSGSSF